ncbi:hypothetical protein DICPUDRAFT_157060 [Dictyostelium purpureum]|uniref:Profilin n=1 Tax=Dictyostelium purpureum TaxID=5786 RepID=F0ZY59_DICPU|nr:uncharacterized protein DICPUDRAFT_157060 [Dictyostelium purpureum]EGC31128.1 hypothetical protein DICPUDRAFT_157060 [Dictyostelium purpureum]|eukprot:XP_003292346.1 hypothetical protein DICPUDRAFT_157060 [Dictyostelium purpureum]
MNFQALIDDYLIGLGMTAGAIIGITDGAVRAVAGPGFNLKAGEGLKIISSYKSVSDVLIYGIVLNGIKYMGIGNDGRSIYGKRGSEGCTCVKTGQYIVIGVFNGSLNPDTGYQTVENLADRIISSGN